MISDAQIWEYIRSDLPLNDATTELCGLTGIDLARPARLEIYTREILVLSGVDTAARIAKILGCEPNFTPKNGIKFSAGEMIFSASGNFENIHKLWKLAQILLEYSCKITTYTAAMLATVRESSPTCQVQTTRKSFPFAKEFCLSAVLAGGGQIHRANLSDSVLFFENHIKAYASFEAFCEQIANFKAALPEKKIMVEVKDLASFRMLLAYAPDVIQCDKMSTDELVQAVNLKNQLASHITITAAGGINLANCAKFAATGIDAIITTAPYMQGACDLTARIEI